MRFRKTLSVVLLLCLMLTFFTSCKKGENSLTESETESIIPLERQAVKNKVKFEKYITEINLPYAFVDWPYLCGDKLYFCAAEKGSFVRFKNIVGCYDLKTKETAVLYEMTGGNLDIQRLCANEKYLVWLSMAESGETAFYLMDLESGGVKKIYDGNRPFYSVNPCLAGESLYFIEHREKEDGTLCAAVAKIDLASGAKSEIAKLNYAGTINGQLHENEGYLIWTDVLKDSAFYFVYNTSTGGTVSYRAKHPYAGYALFGKGLIVGAEYEDEKLESKKIRIFHAASGEDLVYEDTADERFFRFAGRFLATVCNMPLLYKIEDGKLRLLGELPSKFGFNRIYGGDGEVMVFLEAQDSDTDYSEEFLARDKKVFILDLSRIK